MATLAKCLDQTTDISKAEKKALLKSAQQYLDEGHGEKSSIKAVQDVLKEIDTERSDILAQVRKLNQATTILDKIAESPKFEIGDYVMPKPDSGISDKRYPARVQHISRGGNGEQTLKVEHSGSLHFAAYNFDKVEKPAEKPAPKEDVSIDDLSAMIDEIGAEEGLIEKPVSPGGKAEGVKTGLAAVADILKDIDGSANFQVARQDVPPVTHPEAYAQAKEHLSESYAEFIQKGNEIKEWVRHALVELKKLGAPFELSKNWVLNFYANDRPELDKAPDSDNIIDKDKEAQDAETTTDRSPEGEQGGVLPANEEGGGFGALFGPGSGGVRGPESVNDSRRDEGTRSDGVHTEGPVGKSVLDYRISSSDRLGAGGAKTKYANNVAAIKALQRLGDKQATIEDQRILAKYVGWGGIPQAFYRPDGSVAKGWGVQASELQNLLSKEEYEAARASTQDAHYTSEAIIKSIYKGLARIGFRSGKILEPSVGTGNFLGIIPKKIKKRSKFVAVEKDNITAAIAKHLYPEQKVHQTGFEKFDITPGSFDLAIGNPPFGSKKLFDPNNKNLRKFSIHNFFFAKSLIGLRPNGLLSMVVSSAMMDKNNSTQRRWLAERAELLGAVRLPNNAFKGNAGTEVTTDIIFLRKREEGEYRGGPSWENLKPVIGPDGVTYHVNEYFADNPDKMLGELAHNKLNPRAKEDIIENGVYRAVPGMVATGDMAEGLKAAIESLPEGVYVKGKRLEEVQNPDIIVSDPGFTKVYGYTIDDNGNAARRLPDKNGEQRYEPILYAEKPLEGKRLDRLKGMLKIRDTVRQLIREEISDGLNIETLRRKLNSQYDLFQKNYGYISAPGNQQVMKDDPTDYPLLRSLEDDYDKGLSPGVAKKTGETPRKKSAKKAAIFRERLRHPYHAPIKAADAKEALAISLREDGVVDMDRIVSLSGKTEQDAIEELAGFVFLNPANETWETRDFYLSGNVKEKLREAKRVGYQSNIEALKEVQPKDVDPGNIFFKIGATWIPGEIYEGFADEVLHATATVIHHEQVGRWTANIGNSRQQTGLGTDRMDAGKIFEKIVQSRDIAIYDTMEDRTRVFNREATLEANQKADEMQRAFNEWALKDHARSEILAKEFNDKVNTNVKTVPDGSHMIFPGMGVITAGVKRDDQLRPHQKDVVWRLIQKGLGLLDHVVGSGKTFAAIAAGMEMKRMGLAQKPMYVVPNHLVSQWADDFQKLYPGANVLVITRKDFTAKKRQEFMGRITTGSWDAVLMAHSSFGFVRAPVTYQQKFYRDMIAQYEEAIEQMREAEGKKTRSVKQAEKARDRLQEKLDALGDMTGDDVVDFGDLGVDALFVDEAHEYKNLFYATSRTRIAGLGNPAGSKKAFDMFVKTRFLQENNSGKGVFFLTGTPVSNTIAEMYTMMRYMSYDRLESMGIKHFDQWANMFADLSSDWEVDPSGTRYRLQSRFRGFVNTPGMMGIYKDFADVISQQNLIDNAEKIGEKWPVPEIKGGKPENVVVERSDLQGSFMRWIVQRMDNMPSDPSEDNPLKATGEAMKAALDIRLINENLPDHPGSKVNKAIGNIFDIYKKWTPRKGAQLVFCDLSVPKKARTKQHKDIVDLRADLARIEAELEIETRPRQLEKLEAEYEKVSSKFERFSYSDIIAAESSFSVYDDIKKKLIKKGVPENEIAFIHDANTDIQKGDLFAKVRAGRIRVLIGSTFKMGAGMNVQKRLVALHHLDAPWRPSDLEQREGRIIRQGNDFFDESMDAGGDLFEVEIYRYATKETLDTRRWQIIEGKAKVVEQLRAGGYEWGEVIEDAAGEAENAAAMKAAASGNPLILEEIQLRQEIQKLEGLRRGWENDRFRANRTLKNAGDANSEYEADVKAVHEDIASIGPRVDSPEDWSVTLDGKVYRAKNLVPVPEKLKKAEVSGDEKEVKKALAENKKAIKKAKDDNAKQLKKAKASVSAELVRFYKDAVDLRKTHEITYRGITYVMRGSFGKTVWFNADFANADNHNMGTWYYQSIDGFSPGGVFTRANNSLRTIKESRDAVIETITNRRDRLNRETGLAKEILERPFEHEDRITEARTRHGLVLTELQNESSGNDQGEAEDFSQWTGGAEFQAARRGRANSNKKGEKKHAVSDNAKWRETKRRERSSPKQGLDRIFDRYFPGTSKDTKIVTRTSAQQKHIRELLQEFGLDAVFWKNKAIPVNGVTPIGETGTIYLNADSKNPLLMVSGHEVLHTLKQKRPDLYEFLDNALKNNLVNFENYAENINYDRELAGIEGLGDEKLREELYADFLGDQFANPAFWAELQKQSEPLTRRLIDAVMDIIRNLVSRLKKYDRLHDKYFKDLEGAQGVMAGVLSEYKGKKAPETVKSEANFQPQRIAGKWYSAMEEGIQNIQQKTAPAKQWLGMIRKVAKEEELAWSGIEDWLNGKDGKVTKQEILDYLAENNVQVKEVEKGQGEGHVGVFDSGWDYQWDDAGTYIINIEGQPEQRYAIEEESDDKWGVYDIEDDDGFSTKDRVYLADSLESARDYIENELVPDREREMIDKGRDETKFSQWQVPGGENYRELLLTLPDRYRGREAEKITQDINRELGQPLRAPLPGRSSALNNEDLGEAQTGKLKSLYDELDNYWDNYSKESKSQYTTSHWNEPNVLAHVRFNTRTVNGKKVLFLEEIQSDWHQEGRKKGYVTPSTLTDREKLQIKRLLEKAADEGLTGEEDILLDQLQSKEAQKGTVPGAPFKKTWPLLAFKRMVRYAAENGYDSIAWTPGDVQADRYDLSKQVSEIAVKNNSPESWNPQDNFDLQVKDLRGDTILTKEGLSGKEIEEHVGKEMAERLTSVTKKNPAEWRTAEGRDLKVGGQGMKGFYDKILPSMVNKFFKGKKWGKAKVGSIEIIKSDVKVHGEGEAAQRLRDRVAENVKGKTVEAHNLKITPEMQQKALTEGMAMFQVEHIIKDGKGLLEGLKERFGKGYSDSDMKLFNKAFELPYWLGKRFKSMGKAVKVEIDGSETRSTEVFYDYDGDLGDIQDTIPKNKAHYKELIGLIWAFENRRFSKKDVPTDWHGEIKEGHDIEINPEHYEEVAAYLKKRGATPEVIHAFVTIRKVLDRKFIDAEATFRLEKLDPELIEEYRSQINKIHNYFPHKREGNSRVVVTDSKDKTVYSEHYYSMTDRLKSVKNKAPARARKWLADAIRTGKLDGVMSDYTVSKPHPVKNLPDEVFFNVPVDAMQQLVREAGQKLEEARAEYEAKRLYNKEGRSPEEALKLAKQRLSADMEKALSQAVAEVFKGRGWGGHAIHRKGIPGHETEDVFGVLFDYLSGYAGFKTKITRARQHHEILTDINAKKSPEEYKYVSQYVQDMLANQDDVDRLVDGLRGLFFVKYLGFSLKSGMVNLTQNVVAAGPILSQYSKKSHSELAKAMKDTKRALVSKQAWTSKEVKYKHLSANEQKAIREMIESGASVDLYLRELKGNMPGHGWGKHVKKVIDKAGIFMQIAEKFNRTSTGLAAYRVAIANGETHEGAVTFAKKIIYDSHFLYGKSNLPSFARGGTGQKVARAGYTFRSFTHNYLEMMAHLFKNQGPEGKKAFARSLRNLFLVGGLTSMPFFKAFSEALLWAMDDDDEDALTIIRDQMPYNWLKDLVVFGLPGVAGFDLTGSLSIEVPRNFSDIIGVPYAIMEDTVNTLESLKSGANYRALSSTPFTPIAARNAMRGLELYTTGQRTRSGRDINEIGKPGPRKISGAEAFGKGVLGLQPVSVSKGYKSYQARTKVERSLAARKQKLADRYVNALRKQDTEEMDKVKRQVSKWNAKAIKDKKYHRMIALDGMIKSRLKQSLPAKRFRREAIRRSEAWQ